MIIVIYKVLLVYDAAVSVYVLVWRKNQGNFWTQTWLRVKAYWFSVKMCKQGFVFKAEVFEKKKCSNYRESQFMQLSLEASRLKNIYWRQKFNFRFKCWNWERKPFEGGSFWTNANSALTRNYHKPCTVSNAKDMRLIFHHSQS